MTIKQVHRITGLIIVFGKHFFIIFDNKNFYGILIFGIVPSFHHFAKYSFSLVCYHFYIFTHCSLARIATPIDLCTLSCDL